MQFTSIILVILAWYVDISFVYLAGSGQSYVLT